MNKTNEKESFFSGDCFCFSFFRAVILLLLSCCLHYTDLSVCYKLSALKTYMCTLHRVLLYAIIGSKHFILCERHGWKRGVHGFHKWDSRFDFLDCFNAVNNTTQWDILSATAHHVKTKCLGTEFIYRPDNMINWSRVVLHTSILCRVLAFGRFVSFLLLLLLFLLCCWVDGVSIDFFCFNFCQRLFWTKHKTKACM